MTRLLALLCLALAPVSGAATHVLERGVFGIGGGDAGSSPYAISATLGQAFVGASSSGYYAVEHGFWNSDDEGFTGGTGPVAGDDVLMRPDQRGSKVAVSSLLANDTDPHGGGLSITAVDPESAEGGVVRLSGGWVFYTPPVHNPAIDTFSYTVADGRGVTAAGVVTVMVAAPDNTQPNTVLGVTVSNGLVTVSFAGIPGQLYIIQATTDLNSPDWQTIGTATAGANGRIQFTDPDSPSHPLRYYRTAQP